MRRVHVSYTNLDGESVHIYLSTLHYFATKTTSVFHSSEIEWLTSTRISAEIFSFNGIVNSVKGAITLFDVRKNTTSLRWANSYLSFDPFDDERERFVHEFVYWNHYQIYPVMVRKKNNNYLLFLQVDMIYYHSWVLSHLWHFDLVCWILFETYVPLHSRDWFRRILCAMVDLDCLKRVRRDHHYSDDFDRG